MTFTYRTDLWLANRWVDVTDRVRGQDGITITRGRADEQARPGPGRAGLVVKNETGDFSPRNPNGTWYGWLTRNTGIRIAELVAADSFGRTATDTWASTDTGQAWTASGGAAANYDVAAGVGTMSIGATNSTRSQVLAGVTMNDSVLTVTFPPLGLVAAGSWIDLGLLARWADSSNYYMGLARLDTDGTVTAVIRRRLAATNTTLATAVGSFTYDASTSVTVEFALAGYYLQLRVWDTDDPTSTSTVEATDDTLAAGSAGVRSILNTGNSNTLPLVVSVDDFRVDDMRFSGEVPAWPTSWAHAGRDVRTAVEAAGIMRRLAQNSSVLQSAPLRWLYRLGADIPVAAWPLEEGPLATAGQPLFGNSRMRPYVGPHPSGAVSTYPQFGRGELGPWLPGVLSRSGNAGLTIMWASVSMPETVSEWAIDFVYASGTDAAVSAIDVNPGYLGGALGWPQLTLDPTAETVSVSFDGSPETTTDVDGLLFDGVGHHVRWHATQDGADVDWTVSIDGVAAQTGTETTSTLPPIGRLGLTSDAQSGASVAIGYVSVWTTPADLADAAAAALGYPGEAAGTRIARLCAEEGIRLVPIGDLADTQPCGPQGVAPLMELLNEAADADMGLLHEPRQVFGLAYRTRASLYNQSAALALDYAAEHLTAAEPVDDDQRTRNDVEVTRRGGASARRTISDGPLSILDPPEGVGTYGHTSTLNVAEDSQLPDLAGWIAHLGTVDEPRRPSISARLHAPVFTSDPALLAQARAVEVGDVITIANLPQEFLPPDTVAAMVHGYTETLNKFAREVTWNTAPASPWTVAVLDDDVLSRLDTAGAVLSAGADSTQTNLIVTTTSGPRWTTDPADVPFDVTFGGEVATVTAIAGTGMTQTFTVTRSVNGVTKSHLPDTAVWLADSTPAA